MVTRCALTLLLAWPALATHDADGPVTDYSAYTLRQYEGRVGPGRVEYGVLDSVDVGFLSWLWYLRVRNIHAKWRVLDGDDWAASLKLGVANFNAKTLGDDNTDAQIWIVPFEAVGTWRSTDFSYNLGLGYTLVRTVAGVDTGESGAAAAALDVSVGYLHPSVEWRLGPVFALVAESRIGLFQQGSIDGETELVSEDGRTKIEVFANADADLSGGASLVNLSLSGMWSWEHLNLRAGLGYGHYAVPGVNLFIPIAVLYPELAVFWRF